MGRPEALLFDLGRVLVGYDWRDSLRHLATRVSADRDPVRAEDVVAWMLGPEGPHDDYCRGRIDDRQLLDAIHERFDPRRRLDDAWIVDLWCDMFEPWPEALAVVDSLRGRVPLGLVSNTNSLHFEHLDARLALRERFDHLSLSHEVGALKPHPALYRDALGALDVPAASAWFTDDLPENVEGARALGLRAERFTNVPQLRRQLRHLGFDDLD